MQIETSGSLLLIELEILLSVPLRMISHGASRLPLLACERGLSASKYKMSEEETIPGLGETSSGRLVRGLAWPRSRVRQF
jgi:hypothetical protein